MRPQIHRCVGIFGDHYPTYTESSSNERGHRGKGKGQRSQDGNQRDEHDASHGLCFLSEPQCYSLIRILIPELECQLPPPLSPHTHGTGGTWKENPREIQTRSQQRVTLLSKALLLLRDQQWSLTLTFPGSIWCQITTKQCLKN